MGDLPKVRKTASYIEARIHRVLKEHRAATSNEKKERLALSQIGGCERNLWAAINGIPNDRDMDPRMLVLFDLGNAVEAHLIELLKRAGYNVRDTDPKTGEQIRVTGFGNRVSGRLDGEIELGSRPGNKRWALLELKSAKAEDSAKPSPSSFESLERAGSYEAWNPKYGAQLQVYMGRRELAEALVVVECKNDSRLWIEIVDFDPGRFASLWAKAERIVTAETVPNRPIDATSQYCKFCKWCDRSAWCWGPLAEVKFDA